MAYKYRNDMGNNYNELMPDSDYFNVPPTPNITPIQESGFSNPNWDWGGNASGVPNAQGINMGGDTGWNTQSGNAPGWGDMNRYMGEGIKDIFSDGFQGGDLGQLGGLAKDYFNFGKDKALATGTGQAGKELWGGLDNAGKFGTIFSGLETLGGLYKGFKGMQMAKDQMAMQKDMWNKSWDANKKQFNESVASRAQGRHNGYNDQQKRDDYNKKYSI